MSEGQGRALREQAVRLTQEAFSKMAVKPLRSVGKVAPVVHALLIEQALAQASVHTESGIQFALSRMTKPDGARPKIDPIKPYNPPPPSEEERAKVRDLIADTRAHLRGIF